MTLEELIGHYNNATLPKPAYATLCALRRLSLVERCRYAVRCKGIVVATFVRRANAEAYAELGRRDTPPESPIDVVDLTSSTISPPANAADEGSKASPFHDPTTT